MGTASIRTAGRRFSNATSMLAIAGAAAIASAADAERDVTRNRPSTAMQPVAFPGAEGHGRYTSGGRGGDVLFVTTLADHGPGSLRAAIERSGTRTIVFRIAGTIDLESDLKVESPNLTIAGQSAPGDGITLKGRPLIIAADNVIVRFIRLRLGGQSGEDADALSSRFTRNLMIDHVSASWSVDETLSVYHGENVTVQWSMITESLYASNHVKGSHGFGGIWGSNRSTYHHNLIAHHSSRNPRFASGSGNVDFRNNVIFNWGFESSYGGEAHQVGDPRFSHTDVNIVANYYKPGPATLPGPMRSRIVTPWTRGGEGDFGRWYVAGNVMAGNARVTADNWDGGVIVQEGAVYSPRLRRDRPWNADPITQQTPWAAYLSVLKGAGTTRPRRDSVDKRIVAEVRSGRATYGGVGYRTSQKMLDASRPSGIIDSPADVGGWPALAGGRAPNDRDLDGMPDDWERRHSLDPDNAGDRNTIGRDGYTMLEIYLNGLV